MFFLEAEPQDQGPRNNEDIEPVCFGAKGIEFYEDVFHSLNTKAVIFLTTADANGIFAAARQKIATVAVTHNDEHTYHLKRQLIKMTFLAMQEENGPLYTPALVEALAMGKKGQDMKLKTKVKECLSKDRGQPAAKPLKSTTKPAGLALGKQRLLAQLKAMQEGEDEMAEGVPDGEDKEAEDIPDSGEE